MKKQNLCIRLIAGILCLTHFSCSKNEVAQTAETDFKPNSKSALNVVASTKIRKVLFIGIDGCLWATFSTSNTPNIKALMNTGYASTNALAEVPTWSATGWSGLLTGTSVTKHKAYDNSFSGADFTNNPTFFKQIKASLPAYRTGSIATWTSINNTIINSNDITFKTNPGSDGATETAIVNELTNNNPSVLFCHFDDVDHEGHTTGFSTTNTAYVNVVKATDTRIGHIITALQNRANYINEDWLIVISSDHGGTGTSHGGSSYVERNSFIILNNPAIPPTLVNQTPSTVTQTSPNTINTVNFGTNVYGTLPLLGTSFPIGQNNSFTIEFRVRATANTSDPVIIGNKSWASGANKGIIISNNGGTIKANFGDGSKRADLSGIDLTDGYWHNVSIVVDRGPKTITMYDGGVQVAQTSLGTVKDLQSNLAFRIGQDGTTNYPTYFSGNIAGIRLFKTVLSATTIANNAFSDLTTSHPNYASLAFYTKGNDGSGTQYAGSLGSQALTLNTKNGATINWASNTTPVFLSKSVDYHNAPNLYDVAPTILDYLNIAKPTNYSGNAIIDFQ